MTTTGQPVWTDLHHRWAYDDLLELPDDGWRYEIIDGQLVVSPPPHTLHQVVLARLCGWLDQHVVQPDERLVQGVGVLAGDTYVIPDAVVLRTLDMPRGEWAPELVSVAVEVVSPSSSRRDRWTKRGLYAELGIELYLVVDPDAGLVHWHDLDRDARSYDVRPPKYTAGARLVSLLAYDELRP